ncbi:MAG: amidohydrolase family protein [Hamadaea sp.]|uniref:amidohydrolase family protein n=1 Tax=Hamadaea sp. TaxID=2024425 RepID=UPI001837171C|nr:amidohydrolase family protein [Hamadaea sp.]NUR71072.1 amidohydrolase family protein [Hamadaea sp.]NUT23983.1 amidohydrolase family protein [Hamadaea sp.]
MLALRAARLFDGEHAALLEQPVVLVEQGRIVAAAAGLEPPADAEVVELGDATLMPGLVDAHIHLTFDASRDAVGRFDRVDDAELLTGAREAAARALRAGVTTVRDLGDRNYVTLALRDEPGLPRILSAGPPITSVKGHCWFLGGEALGVDGVRQAVRERAERGVDVVKVMATGGELTAGTHPHLAQFGMAAMRAAVDEAHRAGLPITAHAHGAPGIFNAAAAGFDSVEHCSFTTETGASADDAVIQALLANGVTVSATLGHLPGLELPPRIAALIPQLSAVFHRIREAGVPVVCSSDAGIGPAKPHDCLPYGVGEMVTLLGYAPADALRSMTSRAADLCRVGDRVGRIRAGYEADLLAVAGNPLVDTAAMHDVVGVWRGGVRVR